MSWQVFSHLVPDPADRLPLSKDSFLTVLAPLACYYATAVTAQLPGTLYFRMALLPISLWTAFRAATSVDVTLGSNDPGFAHLNYWFCFLLFVYAMRATEWTLCYEPLQRISVLVEGNADDSPDVRDFRTLLRDAVDLCFNYRGLGWNWSPSGLHVPQETRTTTCTTAFVQATLVSALKCLLLGDTLLYAIQHLYPYAGITVVKGSFDPSLSPFHRYVRSCLITYMGVWVLKFGLQTVYHILTLVGILVFQQSPSQWPPCFDKPWTSTSHTELWKKRWHQSFRHSFVTLGGKPLSLCIGRFGWVLGTFFISGWLHSWAAWGMGQGTNPWSVGGTFMMVGVAIILEWMWKKVSGVRVGGTAGRVWFHVSGMLYVHPLIDAGCRVGLFDARYFPERIRPAKFVAEFITWLVQRM